MTQEERDAEMIAIVKGLTDAQKKMLTLFADLQMQITQLRARMDDGAVYRLL